MVFTKGFFYIFPKYLLAIAFLTADLSAVALAKVEALAKEVAKWGIPRMVFNMALAVFSSYIGIMNKEENNHIKSNPEVLVGKPVIKDTRIPVALILNLLAHGYSIERVIEAYPVLSEDDVRAAIGYAEGIVGRERIEKTGRVAHA